MNTAFWIRRMMHDGLSSSSLSMRLVSSLITRQTKNTGMCLRSCVDIFDLSEMFQYFRCFFRQRDVSINSAQLSNLNLQPGPEHPTIVPWIQFRKSASTTLRTQH